jgi:hypothetical protein
LLNARLRISRSRLSMHKPNRRIRMSASRTIRWPIAACSMAILFAGCATSVIEGHWADTTFSGRSLLKSRVLVSCRAPDVSLAKICEDNLASGLRDAGVVVLRTPEPIDAAGGVPAVLSAAKALSADSLVMSSVSISASNPYGTSSAWGYPWGLYGGLGGGRGVGMGTGMGFTLGGVQAATAFSAASSVVEVASGQELWSVRVPPPGSDDAAIQVARLSGASIDAMRRAGLLGPIAIKPK